MSRKLDTLKEQYLAGKTLSCLIEYMEQCKKEELWEEIIAILDGWDGSENLETNFYYGVALLNLGKKDEGADRLLKVMKINPNHFSAKKELEKFEISGDDESKLDELNNEVLKKIFVVQNKIETNEHYKRVKFRNISIVVILVTIFVYFGAGFFKTDKAKSFNQKLKDPQASFHSLNYAEYARNVREYKMVEVREEIGEPLKRSIFYLSAYAILDYRLERERDDVSQFKLYSTLIDKDSVSSALIGYIDGSGEPLGTEIYHKLAKSYPFSGQEINRLEITLPEQIDRSNLRESFYKALMLFRRSDFDRSNKIAEMILEKFPEHELSAKLRILIKAGSAIAGNRVLVDISKEKDILERYKAESIERDLYGEAIFLLGKASGREDLEREGFYSVCPGKYFCRDIVYDFMNKGATSEAARMALFMREQKDSQREPEDIKLVMTTSFKDGDYSNCYFAFKELQQFFPDSVDEKTIVTGAECSEMNGYYEEAVKGFEIINEKAQSPEITAKILRMKYIMTRDELYYNQLKALSGKYPDNLQILYSFLEALKRMGDISETVSVLDKIYELETPENRMSIIREYLNNGAVMQAVNHLENGKAQSREYRLKLSRIYNRYMLFDQADKVLLPGEDHEEIWKFLREQHEMMDKEELEHVIREVDKRLQSLDKCEPALLFLKAEIFRRQGDRQRTLGMIDAMIECDRFYLPGLVFAAEITYYQGDITRATEGLAYILNHEKFFSPGSMYYRNYLVLLNAEIMVTMGRDAQLENYLKRNLVKSFPLGPKEMEKVNDIASKLKISRQKGFMDYLRRNFKILKSEN